MRHRSQDAGTSFVRKAQALGPGRLYLCGAYHVRPQLGRYSCVLGLWEVYSGESGMKWNPHLN